MIPVVQEREEWLLKARSEKSRVNRVKEQCQNFVKHKCSIGRPLNELLRRPTVTVVALMLLVTMYNLTSMPFQIYDTHYEAVIDYNSQQVLREFDSIHPAIFYNIYLPSTWKRSRNAARIVREQLAQISASDLVKSSNQQVQVLYNTIGHLPALPSKYMNMLCRKENLNCTHLQHHQQASEDTTLDLVHQFCRSHPAKEQSVIYLHNKGSYHKHLDNERWRRHLTLAALDSQCIEAVDSRTTTTHCNACGLQFFPVWAPFFAGNMWTTTCDYVAKLQSPAQYKAAIDIEAEQHKELVTSGKSIQTLYNVRDNTLCQGRYSSECWVASHPSLQPCDLSTTADLMHWQRSEHPSSEFLLDVAPRNSIHASWYDIKIKVLEQLLQNDEDRMREFFLLPGYLRRWINMYNATPPVDSWAWSWFPDGKKWKDMTNSGEIFDII